MCLLSRLYIIYSSFSTGTNIRVWVLLSEANRDSFRPDSWFLWLPDFFKTLISFWSNCFQSVLCTNNHNQNLLYSLFSILLYFFASLGPYLTLHLPGDHLEAGCYNRFLGKGSALLWSLPWGLDPFIDMNVWGIKAVVFFNPTRPQISGHSLFFFFHSCLQSSQFLAELISFLKCLVKATRSSEIH